MSKRRNEDTDAARGGKVKDCRKLKMKGNTNASKEQRKIVLGWFNYHQETKCFRQVREKHGGGSREVKINKSWTAEDILKFGKTLFFPDGKSQVGDEEDFDFSLKDFQQADITPDITVSDMYQETHIKLLKFYVFSKPKGATGYDSDDNLPKILNLSKPSSSKQSDSSVAEFPVDSQHQHGPVEEDVPYYTAVTESGTGTQFAPVQVVVSSSGPSLADSNTGRPFVPVQVILSNSGSQLINSHNGNNYQHEENLSDIDSCTASDQITTVEENVVLSSPSADRYPTSHQEVQTDEGSISYPLLKGSQDEVQYQGVQAEEIIASSLVGSFLAESQNGSQYQETEEVVASSSGSHYLQHVRVDDDILFSIGSMSNLQSFETPKSEVVKVHQGNCFAELLHLFHDSEMTLIGSHVKRILPSGEEEKAEVVGLIRDIFTEFWDTFYLKCCEGCEIKIPILRHDMGENEWEVVGRIICDGYESVGYFPVKIAKSVIEDACFGTHQADYTTKFLKFLPQSERKPLETALRNFNEADLEELLDVLDSHGCKKVATAETLTTIIREIAHKEIIQEPKFIIECWRSVFGEKLRIDHVALTQIYDSKEPSVKKVLQHLIFPSVMLSKEQSTGNFLKRFIKGLDEKGFRNFLRFCTGSDLIGENITVEFTTLSGFERRPTAQTCGSILKLPTTYESYADMKEEFHNILTSNVWEMGYV